MLIFAQTALYMGTTVTWVSLFRWGHTRRPRWPPLCILHLRREASKHAVHVAQVPMLTIITSSLSFQAGFHAPATSPARAMATMDATALKQARSHRCRSNSPDSLPCDA